MNPEPKPTNKPDSVEMPEPTSAPLVLSVAITLLTAGVAMSAAFLLVGGLLFVVGLGMWIYQLLPGRGHYHEPLVEPQLRPRPVAAKKIPVAHLKRGMPGYRLRLPEKVHPISAGVKGGLIGGLVMPLPAMIYGAVSGHGIWLPVNLLAGMALPGVDQMGLEKLEQFQPLLFTLAMSIHVCVSLIVGMIYGVLMPMLPELPKPLAWGALLMPMLWSLVSFVAMGWMNLKMREHVDWPWFVVSQFIFGVVAALVFMRFERHGPRVAGLLGGAIGGLLMMIPALLWGHFTGRGIWFPINLHAAMVVPNAGKLPLAEFERFHAPWFAGAAAAHAVLSLLFGLAFAVVLPRLPRIAASLAWGGLLMPLIWTGLSYSLMGIVNPVLQQHVDWPWFIVSQFVFGVVAAVVIVRSEKIAIPPAGQKVDFSSTPSGN